ncbi:MAG: DUF4331 family protein [Nevskia sp.]|nr:DUF4331 family protein [Nevskia sp.]
MNRLLIVCGLLLSSCGGGSGGPSSYNPQGFSFATAPASAYTRVDRMGGPVTATVLITAAHKDLFNSTDPVDDGQYAAEEINTLKYLHYELDPQLSSLGLSSCARTCSAFSTCNVDLCVQQAVPLIIPDLLHLDLTKPDGFPNGRRFQDAVVDRVLAKALLDLTTPGSCGSAPCTGDTLANLPLNPPQNDKPFCSDFPFLADPWPAPSS